MLAVRTLPMFALVGVLTAACGGSSGTGTSTGPTGGTTASPGGGTTTASPSSLLVQPSEVPSGFTAQTAPANYGGPLDATGSQRTFGDAASQAANTMRDGGSATYNGPSNTELVAKDFVFATPADAQAVWSGFAQATGGTGTQATPSGAPGEQQALYQSTYSSGSGLAITYLFREGNVLSEVDLLGPPGQFQVGDVIALATKQDAHIRATLK